MLRRRRRGGVSACVSTAKTRQRGGGSAAWGQLVGELLQERQPFGRHRAGLGGGRGLGIERIEVLEHWVQSGLQPDLTLLFDVPLEVSRERLAKTRVLDRFEQEQQDFHQRVRNCYLERARRDPARIKLIDSTRPIDVIQLELATLLQELI